MEKLRKQGKASVLVAVGKKCIGIIGLSDVLRPEAEKMVKRLHEMKTEVVFCFKGIKFLSTLFSFPSPIENRTNVWYN